MTDGQSAVGSRGLPESQRHYLLCQRGVVGAPSHGSAKCGGAFLSSLLIPGYASPLVHTGSRKEWGGGIGAQAWYPLFSHNHERTSRARGCCQVYSVLNRSPAHLLQEVVLLDDASDADWLGSKLTDYIKASLPAKVRRRRGNVLPARLIKGSINSAVRLPHIRSNTCGPTNASASSGHACSAPSMPQARPACARPVQTMRGARCGTRVSSFVAFCAQARCWSFWTATAKQTWAG